MKTVVDVERRVTCCGVHPVVVGKLGDAEPVNPITLVMVDVETQVLLQLLVHPFRLTVCLWMVCCGHGGFNSQRLEQRPEQFRAELGSSVRDELFWDTILGEYVPLEPGPLSALQ